MVKKRGLGKSLDALLAYTNTENNDHAEKGSAHLGQIAQEKLYQLPIDHIHSGKYQPRLDMDPQALEELANSIRAQGILQPLIVRRIGEKYEIIAGERRWRAAKLAGLTEIPSLVKDISDEAALAIALIENIQRENLNPIEEAIALQRLIEEFGMTHLEVADAIGKSRTTVTNLLRLLALSNTVKNLLQQGSLEMGHARALLALPESLQLKAAEIAAAKNLSVRETENLVRQLQVQDQFKIEKPLDPNIQRLQEQLRQRLNVQVSIYCNAKGKGKLVIHYRSLTELDTILAELEMA